MTRARQAYSHGCRIHVHHWSQHASHTPSLPSLMWRHANMPEGEAPARVSPLDSNHAGQPSPSRVRQGGRHATRIATQLASVAISERHARSHPTLRAYTHSKSNERSRPYSRPQPRPRSHQHLPAAQKRHCPLACLRAWTIGNRRRRPIRSTQSVSCSGVEARIVQGRMPDNTSYNSCPVDSLPAIKCPHNLQIA